MTNLLSGGFSYALMSADSSAKAALKPMNMVSRELRKQNPDLELVERAGKYGGNELNKADESLDKAQEELMKAQKIAKQEEKAEREEKLKEKVTEKKEKESQTSMEDAVERILETSEKNIEEKKNDILNSGNIDESRLDIDKTNIDLTELTKEMRLIDFSKANISETAYLKKQNYSSNEVGRSVLGIRMDLIG